MRTEGGPNFSNMGFRGYSPLIFYLLIIHTGSGWETERLMTLHEVSVSMKELRTPQGVCVSDSKETID